MAQSTGVPFEGSVFRCVPDNGPFDPNELVDRDGANDRWHRPGQPTVYLALDRGVALAEVGRHLDARTESSSECHRLIRLDLAVPDVADLRDPAIREGVGVPDSAAFLDREVARRAAERLRSTGTHLGILVPSAAFMDEPSRGNLVLFAERLPVSVAELVRSWREIGRVELDAEGSPPRP
ncbi:MAG: RES family NAD+ phosphorylase [Chloroflexota bacterium]